MIAKDHLLGFDLGSSSVKVTLLNAETGVAVASANSPATEMTIDSPHKGWAEQLPESWWEHAVNATREVLSTSGIAPASIKGIGISYQMHGLVLVDRSFSVIRPSIIWCDSRAVPIGDSAFKKIGEDYCLDHLLNSPGNFTASKLRWVQESEPENYKRIYKMMLPGDFLAMRLTGEIYTTVSGLSEGIFWDYRENAPSQKLIDHYEIDPELIPATVPTFGYQGTLTGEAAAALGLVAGTPVGYRAGDQPNNAFSLKTFEPGEIAATAGTSGVIYGIADRPVSDKQSRVNAFAHVNHSDAKPRLGILLCVNGTGIMNSWLRKQLQFSGDPVPYEKLNALAEGVPVGSENLYVLPFGNGAERMLGNKDLGASFHGLNLNRHSSGHLCRAVQEGIVFSLAYGFEILNQMGLKASVIRAGRANMFLSNTFCEAFTNITNARIELFNTDGSQGAARGAGVGVGLYDSFASAFEGLECVGEIEPEHEKQELYYEAFVNWKNILQRELAD